MEIIRSRFSFIISTVCGAYIAQNYDVPYIKKLVHNALFKAKLIREKHRKPKVKNEKD
ncbi:hypothetical protein K2173_008704 [Erythroxylum novogranatense]|uniref:Uncharacterized protein n=1 Tax=Erythroxylum novogranatense TaxID=1862640 RepID=A0AAV8SLV2_9ROSI|nr:hypothetical protein K2173_008704 [Erythroxylum novogranatense]